MCFRVKRLESMAAYPVFVFLYPRFKQDIDTSDLMVYFQVTDKMPEPVVQGGETDNFGVNTED